MSDTIIDIFDNVLKYKGKEIMIIFDDESKPWFSGAQIAKIMGYEYPTDAVRNNVSDKRRARLDEIVDDYDKLFPNAQPHAIFINEGGLYELLSNGKGKESEKFKDWIYEQVLPSIRTTGSYILQEQNKKKFDELNKEYEKVKIENDKLRNNQRKIKFPKGGIVYIVQPIEYKGTNDEDKYKIGKTDEMKIRKNPYNTPLANNIKIIYAIKVDDPHGVELCIKGALNKYRYRDKKEYYECQLKEIITAFQTCTNIVERKICDQCKKIHDENKIVDLSRTLEESDTKIDANKKDIYGLIFEIEEEEDKYDQFGGYNDPTYYHLKYLKYAIKYTKLMMQHNC